MSFFTILGRPRAKRPRVLADDRLAVYGRIQSGLLLLSRADLRRMPAEDRTMDVSAYAADERGRAVRLKAICDLARPVSGTLCVNFVSRSGHHRTSHFLAEVRGLGWIAYTADDEADASARGGAFRLILPGIPIDRGRVNDLAWIELADEPGDSTIPSASSRGRAGEPRP